MTLATAKATINRANANFTLAQMRTLRNALVELSEDITTAGTSGIDSLVEDTTPQLGGDLDFDGNTATDFASTGIDDNATGEVFDLTDTEIVATVPIRTPASIRVSAATSDDILAADNGGIIVYTAGTTVTCNLPDTLDQNFQCTIIQAGAGTVEITPDTDTINGAGTAVSPSAQWKGAYITQYADTTWLALL